MKGYINNIREKGYNLKSGYISGDDGNSYYFDGRFLAGTAQMADFSFNNWVEFTPVPPQQGRQYGTAKNVELMDESDKKQREDSSVHIVKNNNNGSQINSEQTSCTEDFSDIQMLSPLSNNQEIITFYKKGFARRLEKEIAYEQHFKKDSGEDIVINKLSEILYISKINHHIIDQKNIYPFCLLGATEILKQYIRGKFEFLLVFSHFDSTDWQQKTLIVDREIRKRKEISDRRPLVNFYILVSNAINLQSEIEKVKGGTSAAVIPFSFEEILNCETSQELIELLLIKFGEYLFENNMLGETNAIDDDNLLFGDRGKIADAIVSRCMQGSNSGIFGLRRSGKTSVLNAVLRRLDRDNIKYIKIESRSELENLDSWKTALYDIAQKIRQVTLSIEQGDEESRSEFIIRLKLNSTEEDYQKRPSQLFVEDVKMYCKKITPFVIAIDEVELITYNTAKNSTWKSIEAYCGFWGALRDCGCALIICGVNSTINEINTITFNGNQGDNPMYGRIINCTESSATYLPAFTDEQTKYMINTLGGYSNIAFTNVYTVINRAFGGQPYAIRQFCSFVFGRVKSLRKPNKTYEVSNATIDNLLLDFNNSAEGNGLCEIILQHLTIFKDEYEMLKRLALSPEKYKTIQSQDIYKIDHLEKYGLIEYDRSTYFVTFKINSVKEYICKSNVKNPMDMSNDERRQYVQDYVAACETKLKTYLRDYYTYSNNESSGRTTLLSYINQTGNKKVMINSKANPRPNPNTCAFREFFDHKKFIMYFSSLKIIISDNWSNLA